MSENDSESLIAELGAMTENRDNWRAHFNAAELDLIAARATADRLREEVARLKAELAACDSLRVDAITERDMEQEYRQRLEAALSDSAWLLRALAAHSRSR